MNFPKRRGVCGNWCFFSFHFLFFLCGCLDDGGVRACGDGELYMSCDAIRGFVLKMHWNSFFSSFESYIS
jgi:hypothetical protein